MAVRKKQVKKGKAAKGGKASSSEAKPAEKAGPKPATSGQKVPASRAKAVPAKAAQAALKAKLNAKKPVDLAPLKAKTGKKHRASNHLGDLGRGGWPEVVLASLLLQI